MRFHVALAAALLAATAAAAEGLPSSLQPQLVDRYVPVLRPGASSEPAPMGACVADLCQPRVSVPGLGPQLSMSGRRTELALTYLDRLHVEPLATAAWWLVATGLRFDYAPGTAGGAAVPQAAHGRFQAFLRFRIDALNRPVPPERRPGA